MTTYELTFIVPTPTVIVTAPHSQIVGHSLTLQCEVTTVRGITSRVDFVWSSDDIVLRRTYGISPTIMDDSLVYTESYTISPLSTADEKRVYQCEVVINAFTPIRDDDNIVLDVIGMQVLIVTTSYSCKYCSTQFPLQ